MDKHLKFSWRCLSPDALGLCPANGAPHQGHPAKHARNNQIPPPGDWWGALFCAGRGWGKTKVGAQFVAERALAEPGHRTALIAPDFGAGRDIMIEGESGLRGLFRDQGVIPWDKIRTWNRSLGELTLTNGSQFKVFGTDKATDAESLRGYQCHSAWFDELGIMRHGDLAFQMLEFALRLGDDPRVLITTTPRPIKLIKGLVKDPDFVLINGTTFDNAANLPARQLKRIRERYENTTLGQQELFGLLLDEAVGALWRAELISHINTIDDLNLVRVVVAVDPAGSHKTTSDETGIIAAGLTADNRCVVLADKSGRYSPEGWADVVVKLYDELNADSVCAEKNYGGDLVRSTLRNRNQFLPLKLVHAMRGKVLRAEPVCSLYERELVTHFGVMSELETQMISWIPPGRFDPDGDAIPPSKESPDRLDALTYALTDLVLKPVATRGLMRFVEV